MKPNLCAQSRAELFADKMLTWLSDRRQYDFTVLRRARSLRSWGGVYIANIPQDAELASDLLLRVIQLAANHKATILDFHEDGLTVEWWDDKPREKEYITW